MKPASSILWIDHCFFNFSEPHMLGFEPMTPVRKPIGSGSLSSKKDDAELLLQTRQSVRRDLGQAADRVLTQSTALDVEVNGFAEILDQVKGSEVVVPQWDSAKDARGILER
jgi:hypothetical protein